MEILSDATFKGNVTTYGILKIRHDGVYGEKVATTITNSEFSFSGGRFSWKDHYKCYNAPTFPYNCSIFEGVINTRDSWSDENYSNKIESCNYVIRGCLNSMLNTVKAFTVSATNANCSKTFCINLSKPGTLVTDSYFSSNNKGWLYTVGIGGPYYTKFNLPSSVPESCVKFTIGVEGSVSESDMMVPKTQIKSNATSDRTFSADNERLLMTRIYSSGCSIPKSIDLYTSGGTSEFVVEKSSGYEISTTDKFVIWFGPY